MTEPTTPLEVYWADVEDKLHKFKKYNLHITGPDYFWKFHYKQIEGFSMLKSQVSKENIGVVVGLSSKHLVRLRIMPKANTYDQVRVQFQGKDLPASSFWGYNYFSSHTSTQSTIHVSLDDDINTSQIGQFDFRFILD